MYKNNNALASPNLYRQVLPLREISSSCILAAYTHFLLIRFSVKRREGKGCGYPKLPHSFQYFSRVFRQSVLSLDPPLLYRILILGPNTVFGMLPRRKSEDFRGKMIEHATANSGARHLSRISGSVTEYYVCM